ncbi:endo-beta-N-acetylglucosaminidase [Mesoplasma corruscae]|uniref:Endo-beta-N-acetylglucosaminidase n=1 Tax=Mesoplasma corruscae TaxID=216874 RepID=A0A2S5RFY2_9MOLU|nr:hypothetical protein [Mesoplasma corruscae]PPE06246.1 endo-beta-N-acetylglucosaminidase [Mesoplasma corruscae]
MKKILKLTFCSVMISSLTFSFVTSCSLSRGFYIDYDKLEKFDFSKNEEIINYDDFAYKMPLFKINEDKAKIISKPKEIINYFEEDFYTGHKTKNEIALQATTGIPLNSKFLPNGNVLTEMGSKNKKDLFNYTNKLSDWNTIFDKDFAYNKSNQKLIKSTKTIAKEIAKQSSDVKSTIMFVSEKSTESTYSILQQNKMFSKNFNNWAYVDYFVNWAGSSSEGFVVPPPTDLVEYGHTNGVKVLGNVFLDGSHGLTKSDLNDFLKRDVNGNFVNVNTIINLTLSLGFDGWFWNNEPNGYVGNGFIVRQEVIQEFIRQLNTKITKSNLDIELISYENMGTLEINETTSKANRSESEFLQKNGSGFISDFFQWPNSSEQYIKKNKLSNDEKFKIFNMYNMGIDYEPGKLLYDEKNLGKADLLNLAYKHYDKNGNQYSRSHNDLDKELKDYFNNDFTYKDENPLNSISIFSAENAYKFGDTTMRYKKPILSKKDFIDVSTLATVKSEYFDEAIYSGYNKNISDNDKGSLSRNYDELSNNKELSFGVGNIVQQNTIINDKNSQIFTNFSTGHGNQFVTISENKRETLNDFLWSDRRMGDLQPTYKWNISESNDGLSNKKIASSNITGYYDYYEPYLKGNSIALGSGFDDNDGKILDAVWDENKTYDWKIFGTNLKKKFETQFTFKYKLSSLSNIDLLAEVKPLVWDSNGDKIQVSYKVNKNNDWVELKFKIIPTDKGIASVGLGIKPKVKKFKLNVGEFSYKNMSNAYEETEININTKNSFIDVQVSDNKKETKNLRLHLPNEKINSNEILQIFFKDYLEKDVLKSIGFSKTNHLFLRNIPITTNEIYVKKIDILNNKEKWSKILISE